MVAVVIETMSRPRTPPPAPPPAGPEPMRAVLFGPGRQRPAFGTFESLERTWLDRSDHWLWVHAETGPASIGAEAARLGLEQAVFRSAADADSPPAGERAGGTTRLLWREALAHGSGDFGTTPLQAFVADRVVATCSPGPSHAADELGRELIAGAVTAEDPPDLAVRLARRLAERLVDVVGRAEAELDELEERVFAEPDDRVLSELTALKSHMRGAARIGRGHERVASLLTPGDTAQASPESRAAASATRELSERLRTLAEAYAQTASDLTDGYLAMSAHRLNRVMQILTVITVVFVPMTFLAGIYGMNFANMPELGTRYGYFVVVAVMVVAGVAQVAFFRRRKWI